jgi:hypothetical protein
MRISILFIYLFYCMLGRICSVLYANANVMSQEGQYNI